LHVVERLIEKTTITGIDSSYRHGKYKTPSFLRNGVLLSIHGNPSKIVEGVQIHCPVVNPFDFGENIVLRSVTVKNYL
jgi:hypothetical protein